MSKMDILIELFEKYKRNSKCSQHDSEEAKQIILELLQYEENKETVIKYIILFPEEIGINSYFEYYKTLDDDARKQLNKILVNSEEFKSNASGRSVNRGTFLVGLFCKDKVMMNIAYILMKTTHLMLSNKTKTIPDKYIDSFRKNILNYYNKELFSIQLDYLNDNAYDEIQTIILNVSFRQIKDEIVKPAIQYGTLGWLLKSNKIIKLSDDEKRLIQGSTCLWPKELIEIAKNDIGLMNTYGEQFLNIEVSNEIIDEKGRPEPENKDQLNTKTDRKYRIDDSVKAQTPVSIKEPSLTEIIAKALSKAKEMSGQLYTKDKKIEAIKQSSDAIQKMYEEKLRENEQLFSNTQELKTNVEALKTNIEILRNKLEILDKEKSKVVIEQIENKEKIKILLDMGNKEESSSLLEYKNKLSSKLKHLYNDFVETENKPMSDKFGENLRIQMREAFNILIKENIDI